MYCILSWPRQLEWWAQASTASWPGRARRPHLSSVVGGSSLGSAAVGQSVTRQSVSSPLSRRRSSASSYHSWTRSQSEICLYRSIHTLLQVQGKWANITLSGCSNIVKISCFWFMLLVNLLSFIYFCFNEILFYFRWIQISICFLLLLQQKYFMRKINIKGRDRDTKFCQSFKWRPKISKD